MCIKETLATDAIAQLVAWSVNDWPADGDLASSRAEVDVVGKVDSTTHHTLRRCEAAVLVAAVGPALCPGPCLGWG